MMSAAIMAVATACAPASVPHTEAPLRANDGLACQAYVLSGRQPVTDVFVSMGGTGTGTSARLPPEMQELLASRSAAFVTFDKPGVRATFGDPSSVRIDDGPFQRHTQGNPPRLRAASPAALAQQIRLGDSLAPPRSL